MNFKKLTRFAAAGLTASMLVLAAPATSSAQSDSVRNVELILDASGSMNGKLPGGKRKINAAKDAVSRLVGGLPTNINLSFRAYGHQFHRSKHNCQDTSLLVPFGAAQNVKDLVIDSSNQLKAQGYTPITHVLGLAADDLKDLKGPKTIILVSDGKETCEGDPCVLSQKLAAANTDLVIHTVGFGADFQARTQLQCIARAGRGQYHDANSAEELAKSLQQVAAVENTEEEVLVITPKNPNGTLEIIGPYFNNVVDAETGKRATKITDNNNNVSLLAGIYNVQFGKDTWLKSVEIIAGETTTINPGRLSVVNPYFNTVLDPETGVVIEKATDDHNDFPLLAGRYNVMFGKAVWRDVEIKEGETTTLNPGRLAMDQPYFNKVLDAETGEAVEKLTNGHDDIPLPPGTYDVAFGKAIWHDIVVREGETTKINPGTLAIKGPYFNKLLDQESGEILDKLTDSRDQILVPPGTYNVSFGKALWRDVKITEGEKVTLNPGRMKMNWVYFNKIIDVKTGDTVEKFTESHNDIPLPPGEYQVSFGNNILVPVTLAEGETFELKPGRIKIEKEGSFYYFLYDQKGERVLKLSSSTNDIPLPAGDYVLEVEGQKVPVTLKELTRKIVKIK